jgi:hypothetical protein
MSDTLVGHLAAKFAAHEENWATEALGYILRRSQHARETVRDLLSKLGIDVPASVLYQNQVAGDDGAQPDLVGLDDKGDHRLVIEAKFWAALTEHQPVTYLGRLPKDGGALIFVVPAARLTLVWAELLRRCAEKGITLVEEATSVQNTNVARSSDGRMLAIVSWRAFLGPIAFRLETAEDRAAREDVAQLRGLCDRMDTVAFLPVTSEELTTHIYRRVAQFGEIVDEVTNKLTSQGIATTNGGRLRAAAGNGWYGRYFLLRGVGVLLLCDTRKWMQYASTPLWLSVYGTNWANWRYSSPQAARHALASLEGAKPPRMFIATDGFPTVALRVLMGVERGAVVSRVVDQIVEVGALIEPLAAGAKPGPVEMPTEEEPPEA